MRFVSLGNVKNGGVRKGFTFSVKEKENIIETPSCFLYTRHGFVPHMTPDLWEKLECLPKMLNTSLNYIVDRNFDRDSGGKGFSHFAQFCEEKPVFLSQTDHTWKFKMYGNDNRSASVWAKGGRVVVTPENFVRHVKACHPQIIQILCDNETFPGCSRKRCIKSVERTTKFTESILEQLEETISSGEILPLGSVVGGFDLGQRQRCAEYMASQKQLRGFVLDGFCSKDECFVKLNGDSESTINVIRECVRHLPKDLPIIMPAIGPPIDVVTAVEAGVDLFDGSFPCILSEMGWAWSFNNCDEDVWIDFKTDKYLKTFVPIDENCGCYACRRHNRAYLTHLVKTKELLAKTLLNIHNSHQYFKFFNHLREIIANGEIDKLKERLNRNPCPDELYTSDGAVLESDRFS